MSSEFLITLPALNEANNLPEVLGALRVSWPESVLVVADGFTTAAAVVRTCGALVVTLPFHLGYGGGSSSMVSCSAFRSFAR